MTALSTPQATRQCCRCALLLDDCTGVQLLYLRRARFADELTSVVARHSTAILSRILGLYGPACP